MSLKIVWSPQARQDYLKLLDFLQKEWGERVVKKFIARLQNILHTIASRPQLYPGSNKVKNVRRCVVNKQISLYYRVKSGKIELITLFDTRQDPSKLKKHG